MRGGRTEAEDTGRGCHQGTSPRQNHCDSVTDLVGVPQKHAQDKDSSARTSSGSRQHSVGGGGKAGEQRQPVKGALSSE